MWSVPIFFKEINLQRFLPVSCVTLGVCHPCSGPGSTAEEHVGSRASPSTSLSLGFIMCQSQRWEGVELTDF